MNNILFFTLIFSAVVFSQSSSILRDIFLSDCTGTIHFFPDPEDSIAAANGFHMQELYSYAIDSMLERVECVCGEVDRTEVLAMIPGTVDYLFNIIAEEKITEITGCPDTLTNFAPDVGTYIVLPDTCDWKNDRECFVQADFGLGVIFDLAIMECPESHFPLVSLGCSGPACDRLFMPCLLDSECGETLSCQEILNENGAPEPTVQNITSFFEAFLLAEGDCLSEQDFWMSFADFIRREAFDNTEETTTFEPKFCLPSVLTYEMNDSEFAQELEAATRFEECDIQTVEKYVCFEDYYCDWQYEDCDEVLVDSAEECPPLYECIYYDYELRECLEISCYEYDVYPNNDTCLYPYCQHYTYDDEGYPAYGVCQEYDSKVLITTKIDCFLNGDGPLSSWDGEKDADLGNVHDWIVDSPFFVPPRTLEPLTEGAIPLFRSDCEGTVQFLPNSALGVSAAFHRFINMYNWIYETARDRFDCEIGGDNDEMFSVHHFLTTFAFLPTSDLETFESFRDLPLDTFASYFFSNNWNISLPDGSVGAYFFEFPETCDWESWTTNGVCAFTYEGLSSLISLDINFNVRLDQCQNDFPALYVECTGDDCDLLRGIVACTPEDSDSCANAECWTIEESLEQIWPTSYDEYGEPTDTEIFDIIASITGVYSDECFTESNEQLYKDWNNLLVLMGLDEEATHVCIPDLSSAAENNLEWFETQWSLNQDDRIVLTDVKAWEAPEFPELPTESVDVGDTDFSVLFVPSIIAFLGSCLL